MNPNNTTLDEILARPRDDHLILQFSTAAPDWKYKNLPKMFKRWPVSMMFNKNYGSGLIRRACHSPFSHVDMVMKDGSLLGASNSPDAPFIHGNPCGVASRPMDYQKFAYRRQMILQTERADDIRKLWASQLGKPFDDSALTRFINDSFPGLRDWRLTDSWFCAEGVVWALEVGHFWGPIPLSWPKNRVSPTDIIMMLINDKRWLNRDTFWQPIPGLVLGEGET
jgi:hypothetical protein